MMQQAICRSGQSRFCKKHRQFEEAGVKPQPEANKLR